MKVLKETTNWPDSKINHVYFTTDDRQFIIGYLPHGKKKPTKFKKPIQWDRRGRTFQEIKL
jgi:hypothetical protein